MKSNGRPHHDVFRKLFSDFLRNHQPLDAYAIKKKFQSLAPLPCASPLQIPNNKYSVYHHEKEERAIFYPQKREGSIKELDPGLGLVHLYFGQGVGKTTRALGLAVRAAGKGIQIDFIQFMKSGSSGEVATLRNIPNIRYRCPGKHPFIMSRGPDVEHFKHAEKAYGFAIEAIDSGVRLLICDEILDTLVFDLLKKEQLLDLMKRCKGRVELVMTGMHAPLDLIKAADYATEFSQIKHPYYKGIRARKGIEY